MEPVPIYGQSFISVGSDGEIKEILIFDYYDPDEQYLEIVHDQKKFDREVRRASLNLQEYLDSQRCLINNKTVSSKVVFTDICHRGSQTLVSYLFVIVSKGDFVKGENTYEVWSDEETLEYDVDVQWCFPSLTVVKEIETKLEFEVYGNILVLWARKGDVIGGHEKIVFTL